MARKILSLSIFFALIISLITSARERPVVLDRMELHQSRIFSPIGSRLPDYRNDIIVSKVNDYSDLKISETVGPATFSQKNSSVASLNDGRFVVVWQDKRLGSYKIYAQVYDSAGNQINSNVLIIGRSDGYDLIEPEAVSNGSGGFYLAWRDIASGRIYAAAYDSGLNEVTAPFVVNDTPAENFAGPFDMDSYTDSKFAVVWEDYGSSGNIALRVFSSVGTPLTAPVKVNTDVLPAAHWVPSVAFDHQGNMAVVWEDYRLGNADIYFQLVYAGGSLNGSNLGMVEAQYDDSAQYLPRIAYSVRDGYAIGWLDRRDGTQKAYLQRYELTGGLSGDNVKISADDAEIDEWHIHLDVNSSNDLRAVWTSIDMTDDIKLQLFGASFEPDGLPIIINSYSGGSRWESKVGIGISDKIICSWTDYRSGNGDIFLQYLNSSGTTLIGDDRQVNDDGEGAESVEPDVAVVDDNKSAIVFTDARNDPGDIFLQIVDNNGNLIGTNVKLNSDNQSVLQSQPSLSVSDTAILTVWNDSRSVLGVTGQRIFGRYMDLNGTPIGDDFSISDSLDAESKTLPKVAVDGNNKALVAWVDFSAGSPHIKGRFLNSDGSYDGGVLAFSTDANDIDNDDVQLAIDPNGIFTVSWLSRGSSPDPRAVFARFAPNGSFINRFEHSSPLAGVDMIDIASAVDNSGRIYLLWEGSDSNLYLSRYEINGAVDLSYAVISSGSEFGYSPHIVVDEENSVVISRIENDSGIRRVYYSLLNNWLNTFRQGFVSSADVEYMSSPRAAAAGRLVTFAWCDPRDGGKNIYSSQISFIPTDIDDDNVVLIPAQFSLEQNFPNPFNPLTGIEFTVPSKSRVNIRIYNILGKKIITLTDEIYEAGVHSVTWDGTDAFGNKVSSGIYLYKMNAGNFSSTKKMILVK